jgi:hypothetical protein
MPTHCSVGITRSGWEGISSPQAMTNSPQAGQMIGIGFMI